MKSLILSVAILLATTILPAGSEAQQPFTAVFTDIDWTPEEFDSVHPDFVFVADKFEYFDYFLNQTKIQAAGRPIVLDLVVHGSDEIGAYLIGSPKDVSLANTGFIVNHIDSIIPNVKKVYLEACYAGLVFKESLRFGDMRSKGWNVEKLNKPTVSFPIMGVDNIVSYPPAVILQDRHHVYVNYHDLRQYLYQPALKADKTAEKINLLKLTAYLLNKYGK